MADLWVKSGVVDQRITFYAPPGLGSSMTVYRQRGVNASALQTSPNIVEDATVPGLYRLLVNQDTTITAGKTTEGLNLFVQAAGMSPQLLRIILFANLEVDLVKVLGTPIIVNGAAPANPIGY